MRKELAQGAMWTDIMIRQYDTLSTSANQVLGYSEKGRRLRFLGFVLVLLTFATGAYCAEEGTYVEDDESAAAALEHMQTTNVVCPVMPDMEADPDIFADYKGKRVYFCCPNCRAAFRRNPEKYLPLLPQFGGVVADITHDHENHGPWLTLPGLIKPVGITTLSCLVLTVAAGLLRRRNPKFLFKWHKRIGIATLVLAVIHLILVLGSVGKPDLASSGPFSAWRHPAASTIEPTSPASPSLPGEKIARSRADDGVFRQSLIDH